MSVDGGRQWGWRGEEDEAGKKRCAPPPPHHLCDQSAVLVPGEGHGVLRLDDVLAKCLRRALGERGVEQLVAEEQAVGRDGSGRVERKNDEGTFEGEIA